jgi:hypothetical protein
MRFNVGMKPRSRTVFINAALLMPLMHSLIGRAPAAGIMRAGKVGGKSNGSQATFARVPPGAPA